MRISFLFRLLAFSAILSATSALAADAVLTLPPLDRGFQLLYGLQFDRAHDVFAAWQQSHPEDPMGPACDAAGFLFSEFHRLGVLESQFYEDDKSFNDRKTLTPDPALRDRFQASIQKAEDIAHARLAKNGKDRDALFALTMTSGLQGDYAALIDKKNLASLRYTKEANNWAAQTLAVDPNCYDAYVASGFSKYIIGSMNAPIRWLVRLGGISGDKAQGIKELQMTADRGRYLAPFANILLAIAYLREHDKTHARQLLASLRDQYPGNPLFAQEIARMDSGH
jgi:hypothetical protein